MLDLHSDKTQLSLLYLGDLISFLVRFFWGLLFGFFLGGGVGEFFKILKNFTITDPVMCRSFLHRATS